MAKKAYIPNQESDTGLILGAIGAGIGGYVGGGQGAAAGWGLGQTTAKIGERKEPVYSVDSAKDSPTPNVYEPNAGGSASNQINELISIGQSVSSFQSPGEGIKAEGMKAEGSGLDFSLESPIQRRMQALEPPKAKLARGLDALQRMPKSVQKEYEPVLMSAYRRSSNA